MTFIDCGRGFTYQEDVDKFMQEPRNASATAVMRRFEEQHAKYKLFEANIFEKKKRFVKYHRLGFDCEIILIANCKSFLLAIN